MICSSTEQESVDAAQILAKHFSLPFVQVVELGEKDRSSTGFLPPKECKLVANEFFENPEVSGSLFQKSVWGATKFSFRDRLFAVRDDDIAFGNSRLIEDCCDWSRTSILVSWQLR
jgi:hypothetical protein